MPSTPEDDADDEQGRDVPVAGRSGGGVHPSFVRRSVAARGRIAELVASGQDDRVKLTVRDPMSAWARVAVTSLPSGTGSLPVTRASMAGSCTVMVPRLSSFSSTSTMTPAKRLPHAVAQHAGLDEVDDGPLVAVRHLVGLLHGLRQLAQPVEHPAGHLGARTQRHADLAGVAVAEPAQRRGTWAYSEASAECRGWSGSSPTNATYPLPRSSRVHAMTIAAWVGLLGSRVRMKSG